MQHRDHYLNCNLNGVPYLLPYGQGIVEHAAGVQVNSVGAELWNAIHNGANRSGLLDLLKENYASEPADFPQIEQDLDHFLNQLSAKRLIWEDPDSASSPYPERFLQIGPLYLSLKGPDALWDSCFSDFSCERRPGRTPHQQIALFLRDPVTHPTGEILVRTQDLMIAENATHYLFLPRHDNLLLEMHVTKDGSRASLYCRQPNTSEDMNALFHAIRFAFLIAAARQGLFAVHSASLLYRDRAWLFSGPSGAGKSTHTVLWKDAFHTPLLNGDLNMIGLEDGLPFCYGLPWCGTSGVRTVESYPLGGIIFLKKSAANHVASPTPDQKTLCLAQRLVSPSWTREQLSENISFCEKLTARIPMFRLYCTREPEAARLMRDAIDNCLDCPGR